MSRTPPASHLQLCDLLALASYDEPLTNHAPHTMPTWLHCITSRLNLLKPARPHRSMVLTLSTGQRRFAKSFHLLFRVIKRKRCDYVVLAQSITLTSVQWPSHVEAGDAPNAQRRKWRHGSDALSFSGHGQYMLVHPVREKSLQPTILTHPRSLQQELLKRPLQASKHKMMARRIRIASIVRHRDRIVGRPRRLHIRDFVDTALHHIWGMGRIACISSSI